MIHFCSVVSSRNVKVFPLAWRTRHSRGRSGSGPGADGAAAGGAGVTGAAAGVAAAFGAAAVAGSGTPSNSPGFTGTVTTSSFFLTLKRWPQLVHWTVSPAGVT